MLVGGASPLSIDILRLAFANFQFSVYDIRIYIYHYVVIFFPVFVGVCLIGIIFSLLLTL